MQIYGGSDWQGSVQRRSQEWQLQQHEAPLTPSQLQKKLNAELSVGDIGLSSRIVNYLEEASVFTVQDMLARQDELSNMMYALGMQQLKDCCTALRNLGFENRFCRRRPPKKTRKTK